MRFDRKPEILAPAGTLETVAAVIEAGADAVYLGGKSLNMRMHRASYNFDDRALAAAVELVHAKGRRIYVTLNSLLYEDELAEARGTLALLGKLKPDGIIVQDLAVAAIAREVCVHVPLHASTMMNVHSVETARALRMLGFVRVVTSRDIPLHEVRRIGEASGLEMEYFVHGDMCIAQSAQCYGSGLLFGESSNRGKCLKSCRWQWELVPPEGAHTVDKAALQGYLLARKDMCLYPQIPELVRNGIASLKIEGRMRTAEFLVPQVAAYRRAVDDYFADPASYCMDERVMADLQGRRVREFSSCSAMHHAGADSVDATGQREPRFFSFAQLEPGVAVRPVRSERDASPVTSVPELAVHVGTAEAAQAALEAGANAIYLGGDYFPGHHRPLEPAWVAGFVKSAAARGARVVVLGTRIADERDLAEWRWQLGRLAGIRKLGVGVSSLGALQVAREMRFREILADFSMNVTNSQAADELSTQGATRVTASIELEFANLQALLSRCRLPVEVVGRGPLPSMVMDYCVVAAATGGSPEGMCEAACRRGKWHLRDTAGQDHYVACDRRCRNHLYMARDLCVLPNLLSLAQAGVATIRVEAQFDGPEQVRTVTAAYRKALDALSEPAAPPVDAEAVAKLATVVGRPMTDGVLRSDLAVSHP